MGWKCQVPLSFRVDIGTAEQKMNQLRNKLILCLILPSSLAEPGALFWEKLPPMEGHYFQKYKTSEIVASTASHVTTVSQKMYNPLLAGNMLLNLSLNPLGSLVINQKHKCLNNDMKYPANFLTENST